MECKIINAANQMPNSHGEAGRINGNGFSDFQSFLKAETTDIPAQNIVLNPPAPAFKERDILLQKETQPISKTDAVIAYRKQMNATMELSGWEKYKDDQLLSNPGGDQYYLDQKQVIPNALDQESFRGRVGKDISDAFSNVKNFFENLFFGAKILSRNKDNQIIEASQRGLIGSEIDFFKDLGSALSFGAWRPDGEKTPEGFAGRAGFFFTKIKEAFFGDLVEGVAGSVIHLGEDLVLAGWNLVEVLPDATVGNFESGRKLTTTIFDNGQVAIDYLTDILPGGEAWLRVHALNLGASDKLMPPILYNLQMPEHYEKDARWQCVRNTPFRKAIETIGSILADITTVKFLGDTEWFSHEEHHNDYYQR